MTLGCVSVGVSEAGGIHRVRMVRRGRCSCKMWLRQHLRGGIPVRKCCRWQSRAGELPGQGGEPSPGSLCGSNKPALHSSVVLVPPSRCKGLILLSSPKPNTSPVPLAVLLGQERRGCRAGAEFVPWDRLWVRTRRALPAPGVSKHGIKKSQRIS